MDLLAVGDLNHSKETEVQTHGTIITVKEHEIIMTVNCVFLSSIVGLFGIVTNAINMAVFCKQGLNTSINVTFFALAISDLSALVMQQFFNVYENPWFVRAEAISIVPFEFKYLTAGLPRAAFTRITCLITVYITMERCLCIIFPLHVKQIITPRRTSLAMVAIYVVTCLTFVPLYCTAYVGWKFYPSRNKSLLGLVTTPDNDYMTQIVYILLTFWGFALFVGVVIFTAILIRKLAEKSNWRKSANADQSRSETISNRDRKTGNMVVLIASILIVCNTPSALLFGVTFIVSDFNVIGLYHHLYIATWSFAFFFETVNSSVNIFLYFSMSTKYRETFNDLFGCKQI